MAGNSRPTRSRGWMFVEQLKSLNFRTSQIQNRIRKAGPEKWAYIIHDKDVNAQGEPIPAHIHLMMSFKSAVTAITLAKHFSTTPERFENMTKGRNKFGIINGFNYLVHRTQNSIDKVGKVRYDPNDVKANFNFLDLIKQTEQAIKRSKKSNPKSERESVNFILDQFGDGLINKATARIRLEKLGGHILAQNSTKLQNLDKERAEIDYMNWRKMMIGNHFVKTTIFIFGETGCGKSLLAKKIASQSYPGSVYFSGGSNDPFQDYEGERAVILDELRPGIIEYPDLLRILDPYSWDTATHSRYHNSKLQAQLFIITTPYDPYFFYRFTKDLVRFMDPFEQLNRRISMTVKVDRNFIYEMKFNGVNRFIPVYNSKPIKNPIGKMIKNQSENFSLSDLLNFQIKKTDEGEKKDDSK
ncbi:Rep family protein [Oenococcus oeni]|uniref:Rep family protein n=1 Tax=Oenococcus oeni TaxID=1247 RepID=UPI0002986681|nr:Rep family protein [Oenococcus oeni]EKP90038.1 Plasmid replication initiator protein [Oenococcus oeni DSM 20252 = AWRIB129]OIL18383.1 plasmid replication initiator protein [Oenococcus oeni]OIL21791.1 plasmid replication initiator protein [Oenococcus oeni]OIL40934.1 plasmid replication initiator protein [Oenococcus oeni]OIL46847.1 plasmid replication initiator protein [Oenococcus oeni]